jgi:hypothetical protein
MAKKVAGAKVQTPPPPNSTTNSATAMPTTTPINSLMAFDPLRPKVTFRPTMAAIGAKRVGVASEAHRDHPSDYSGSGLLSNWPDRICPSAKYRFHHPFHPWSIRQVVVCFRICVCRGVAETSTLAFRHADLTHSF